MKKSKIVVALAAVFVGGAALAQSNVTLYGRVNNSMEWQQQKYSRSVSDVAPGSSVEDTGASYSQKFSGITHRNNSSRFGLKGSEELGDSGLNATFKIEQSVKSDVGGGGNADRRAWVGLEGKQLGSLRLGFGGGGADLSPFYAQFDDNTVQLNHDTGTTAVWYGSNLSYFDIAKPVGKYYDPSANATRWLGAADGVDGFSAGKFSSTFGRASGGNNIAYFSPKIDVGGGNKISAGFRMGFAGTNDSIASNATDLGAGRETDTKVFDLTFNFERDNLFLGLGTQFNTGKGGTYATTANEKDKPVLGTPAGTFLTRVLETNKYNRIQFVGAYQLGSVKIAGLAGFGKDKFKSHTDVINSSDGNVPLGSGNDDYSFKNSIRYFQIGASAPIGKFDVGANYAFIKGKLTGTNFQGTTSTLNSWADDDTYNNSVKRHQFQVAAGYNFSNRTRIYTFLDFQKSSETGKYRGVNSVSVGGADLTGVGQDWRGSVKQTTLGLGLRHNF